MGNTHGKAMTVSAIAALGKTNNVIGKDGRLVWRIPDDLARFKRLTTGHPIVWGRKTFESIGRPLPGRTNIIVTRDKGYAAEGCIVVHSLEDAIEKAKELDDNEIFIGGGGEVYRQALPYVDKLYLTLVDDESEGDTLFPDYAGKFTKETFREERDHEGMKYTWVNLERG